VRGNQIGPEIAQRRRQFEKGEQVGVRPNGAPQKSQGAHGHAFLGQPAAGRAVAANQD
jgi:hypothetical protein